jgi:hypothetical protein
LKYKSQDFPEEMKKQTANPSPDNLRLSYDSERCIEVAHPEGRGL